MNDRLTGVTIGSEATQPVFHVCVTCRKPAPDAQPMGQELYDRLLESAGTAGVRVCAVKCLAACANGCSATISMPGKWAWLLGHLTPDKSDDLLTYAQAYAASKSGAVMPSRRPASLSDMILGRFPALLPAVEEPS
ncbi:DUF1636 domain-containing protein [Acetobacter estunensis]|uniref:DUF1636 family protein n=1 Tax=Acetobacter estunensis TaxID=104097 RepID=UPI001C2D13CC|nr:DUF1636 domain-containing protein [Acetobacter estunensis]MBV1837767.1 DUF1636 domain-containing protein [Acetobacter estunensis]